MDESKKSHLHDLACHVSEICPSLSRYYLLKEKASDITSNGPQTPTTLAKYSRCLYCYTTYMPDNHHIRLLPKMAISKKVQKLLKRHIENPQSLGKFQMKLVKDYVNDQNRLAVTCSTCKKLVKVPGQSRAERYRQIQESVQTPTITEEVKPKTKKEKLKERKKKNKKNRKILQATGVDVGLTSGEREHLGEAPLGGHGPSKRFSCMAGETPNPLPGSSSMLTEPRFELSSEKSADQLKMVPNISLHQKLILDATSSGRPSLSSVSLHNNPKKLLTLRKRSQTKKNSTKMHQQLGDILKAGKEKSSDASLTDFLSSL